MKNSKTIFVLAGAAVGFNSLAALAAEPVSRDEVRAIVSEMLADAETRSSLLAGGGDAGYDKNFFMASADGNYRLNISGYTQFQYIMNFRSTSNTITSYTDEFNSGFAMRQAKIRLSGNVVNPDLTFAIEGQFGSGDYYDWWNGEVFGNGSFTLDDAYVNYNVGNGWSVRGGQYKSYFLKEENNADVYTMSSQRGMVNAAFGQGRVQGIGAKYKGENWWVGADITDGFRTQNTDYTSFNEADFAITGRFEYRFAGTDDQLKDYTSMPGDAMGAMIGAAVHFQLANNDSDYFSADANYLSWTVDGQIEGSGLSLFGAIVGGHTFFNSASSNPDLSDFGFTVQGAWRFAANDEIFLRYDGILLDDNRWTSGTNTVSPSYFSFLTFGYNHYFAGHAAKLTIDCILSLNRTGALTDDYSRIVPTGPGGPDDFYYSSGLLPSNSNGLLGTDKGLEAALRFQFQLMF